MTDAIMARMTAATLRRLRAVVLAAASVVAACGDPFSPTEELDDAREQWESQGIDSYAITVREICFCPRERGGPFRITVRDGRVVSAEYLGEGTGIEPHANFPRTVDDLFATARAAMREADAVEVRYDPTYSFPSDIRVDRIANAIDDEVSYEARDFQVIR
jgi:hypothetical protein